ncbi:MAG: aminopeptidase [Actinobacteria bacterium]|nr:aminopeptidase [Actinomycetota bacterium]
MAVLNYDAQDEKKGLTVWDKLTSQEKEEVFTFCEGYREFLDRGKTEREVTGEVVKMARDKGFCDLWEKKGLKPGDRIFSVNRNSEIVLAVVGRQPLENGLGLVGAHIDSPRIDLKPEPLYQDGPLSLFKTHYYGGIKKYQWVSIPLSLHGVVARQDGTIAEIRLGDQPGDPVFTITDLLPHLAKDQMEKKMSEGIVGEALNILAGGIPVEGDGVKHRIKQGVLNHLRDKYGIVEEDFISAELEAVPAWPAKDVGFDRSLLGGYGQDDRVCAYTAVRALLDMGDNLERTAVVLLSDKEEVGSTGNTGMQSAFFENFVAEMLAARINSYSDLLLRRTLSSSYALSADVNAALDPNYEEVMDKLNSARVNRGVVITKYTGSRGKSGSNEASAEFVARVRSIFNSAGVYWQTGELGKVDQGGGGTIAYLLAAYNMDVLDCGTAILGMHSPFEVAGKADIFMTYRAYRAFLKNI